jgi:hypothetical protein
MPVLLVCELPYYGIWDFCIFVGRLRLCSFTLHTRGNVAITSTYIVVFHCFTKNLILILRGVLYRQQHMELRNKKANVISIACRTLVLYSGRHFFYFLFFLCRFFLLYIKKSDIQK